MNEQTSQVSRWEKIRRVLIIAGSMLLSFWLVVQLIAVGMFDFPRGETPGAFWLRIMAWALGGGLLAGLLWGRSSLDYIAWVLWPGGIFLGLVTVTLPFSLIVMMFDPSDAGRVGDLLMAGAMMLLLAAITFFPVLGPLTSHALRNGLNRAEVREEWRKVWSEVRSAFRSTW